MQQWDCPSVRGGFPNSGAIPLPAEAGAAVSERTGSRPQELNEEQKRSQISSGHRLVRLARQKPYQLYSEDEFRSKGVKTSAEYWLDHFLPALRARMNETMAQRVSAAIGRARSNSHLYGVKRAGIAEYVAEAFFDTCWFKARVENFSRVTLRNQIEYLLHRGETLHLHLPLFSRKPFCPLKNRGPFPDLAEIHSLARCAEAVQVINAISPTGCQLFILADGLKYNRACRTPSSIVATYQAGLRFWLEQLAVADIITIVDYENFVSNPETGGVGLSEREALYQTYLAAIVDRYDSHFDCDDPEQSLAIIGGIDDVGKQLSFTFRSIVTSTYYDELFALSTDRGFLRRHYSDDVQVLYMSYVSSLHRRLTNRSLRGHSLPVLGFFSAQNCSELFGIMRRAAWQAAARYVAISLADRELNVLRRVDANAIKLTVHGKKGEVQFLSATQRDASMTAQHCTGGLALSERAAKVTFQYRLEREAQQEFPVMIERLPDTAFHRERYGPLHKLQQAEQPICYVPDPKLVDDGRVHCILTRRG